MPPEDRTRILHMIEAAESAINFVTGRHGADLDSDQMLLFARFSPMLSFGRPTAGGHVVLSFSAVRVRG